MVLLCFGIQRASAQFDVAQHRVGVLFLLQIVV
jgi:hypothetical protein